MTFVYICLCVILYFNAAASQQFRYDYKYIREVNGWMKHHKIPATFPDARVRCQLEGGVLASPKTEALSYVMRRLMKGTHSETTGIFTGIHALFSKGDFHSIDGTPLERMKLQWMPSEPDNLNYDERCIVMVSNGSIADVNCFDVYPYICYKEKTKNVALTECGTIDREYFMDPRAENCYKFHWVARNWTRAFMACAAEGAYLAIVNSETEATVLKELFAKYPKEKTLFAFNTDITLIGFHDWEDRIVWNTIHGQSLEDAGYFAFGENQPDQNQIASVKCGGLWRNGQLDDIWCDQRMTFICEKPVDSLLEEGSLDI
ncbi:secretory phospholipase A2 receptor-like [Zerene cesonia]|uniref:secretory phospholipase A2 receptor-like n=1 Tax=Zerene cesonia TaxID=33412 RepID=UPI0018E5A0C4|nr:secretory phospholipase A2 receptor-like [Zerene cesonia]